MGAILQVSERSIKEGQKQKAAKNNLQWSGVSKKSKKSVGPAWI